MTDHPTCRRTLLAASVTAGLVGLSGCLRKQEPKASHWAAGIRWADPPGKVYRERSFSSQHGSWFTGPAYAKDYIRVNGGELNRFNSAAYEDDWFPADRGDHIEYVVDFDGRSQRKETVFEYTIPDDDDLIGVLAGFGECHHYQGTDEWIVRPLNVDLGTDHLGRPKETLLVRVSREYPDENPDWYVWGHNESIREAVRDLAAEYADEHDAQLDLQFLDSGEEATFTPAAFRRVGMRIFDGDDWIAGVGYSEPDADS